LVHQKHQTVLQSHLLILNFNPKLQSETLTCL
jgi:hypothetical protein